MPDPTQEDRREAEELKLKLRHADSHYADTCCLNSVESTELIARTLSARTEKVRQEYEVGRYGDMQTPTFPCFDPEPHEGGKFVAGCLHCYDYLQATLAEKDGEIERLTKVLATLQYDVKDVAEAHMKGLVHPDELRLIEKRRLTAEVGRLREALNECKKFMAGGVDEEDRKLITLIDSALSSPPAEPGAGA